MPGKSRSRSPGKKFPSKYEQDVEERREFRMRVSFLFVMCTWSEQKIFADESRTQTIGERQFYGRVGEDETDSSTRCKNV